VTLYLALDTSTEELAVGLGSFSAAGVHLVGEVNLDVPRASLTHLVPSIQRLVFSADLEVCDIGAVIVGRGPGSFTGVRIGVATAKGIAQGLGVPLYGVGTLDAIAERFAGRDGLLGVVGDAMRREVYPALFRCSNGEVTRLTPHAVASPAQVAEEWRALGEPLVLAGNGLAKYADVFVSTLGSAASFAQEAMWAPTGQALLAAAWRARAAGDAGEGDAASVLPVYTRLSDAEVNERIRSGAVVTNPASGVAGPEGADPS
jgi:N6-L-threonylcarbamoyladenine synthase/protein kinase Bud32